MVFLMFMHVGRRSHLQRDEILVASAQAFEQFDQLVEAQLVEFDGARTDVSILRKPRPLLKGQLADPLLPVPAHPNVAPFLGVVPECTSAIYVTCRSATTLRALLADAAAKEALVRSPLRVFRLLVEIMRGLQHLHDHNFVHRQLTSGA